MIITVCYEEGHTPGTTRCKAYGFGSSKYEVDKDWVVYSIYDIQGEPKLAELVIDYLKQYGVEYTDTSFASTVPDSAHVLSGIIDMVLARDDFASIPYKSYTRQWRADKWTEIARRYIPDSDFKAP